MKRMIFDMKSVGVVRKVDSLGRIVLPMELRMNLGIEIGTPLKIYIDGQEIILKKSESGCTFCGQADDVIMIQGKRVYKSCISELKTLIGA
jgi:transcriptional pleiotropic regulator of transition state genes